MGAFFSGTDNNDDRISINYSGVVGQINNAVPATVWRFNYRDTKIDAKFEDIFEPALQSVLPVPSEWMAQVQTGYGGYVAGQVFQGGYGRNQPGFQAGFVGTSLPTAPGSRYKNKYQSKSSIQEEVDDALANAFGRNGKEEREKADTSKKGADQGVADVADRATQGLVKGPLPFRDSQALPQLSCRVAGFQGKQRIHSNSDNWTEDDFLSSPGAYDEAWTRHMSSISGSHQGLELGSDAGGVEDIALSTVGEAEDMSDVTTRVARGVILGHDGQPLLSDEDEELLGPNSPEDLRINAESAEDDGEEVQVGAIYEALAVEYGTDIADAYEDIDSAMTELEGQDELLKNLASDMIGLMADETRVVMFRAMYSLLPEKEKEKLATSGF
jgi:hypothetical protein